MAHGDTVGDVIFDGTRVSFRCHCGRALSVHHSQVDLFTPHPDHTGPDNRASWCLRVGQCSCGIEHYLNPNLPPDHPHTNRGHIEELLNKKGKVARSIMKHDGQGGLVKA